MPSYKIFKQLSTVQTSSWILDTFSIATYSYLIIRLIVNIIANYIICNSNRSYSAGQKQFKLVDFLFQTLIVLERTKRMMFSAIVVSVCQTYDVTTQWY